MQRTKCSTVIRSVLSPYLMGMTLVIHTLLPLLRRNNRHICRQVTLHMSKISKKHNCFVSTYLGLVELLDADANGIVNAMIDFLTVHVNNERCNQAERFPNE